MTMVLDPNAGISFPDTSVQARAAFFSGQCRLTLLAGNLKLSPFNGNLMVVNGAACTIPDAGVTLAATGLLATTLYNIYAVATAGVITSLEASITGHSTDTAAGNKGVEIKTGDSTRSFIGLAYAKVAATFADNIAQRFVRSWFNTASAATQNQFTATRSTSSGTLGEISSEIRCELVLFVGETLDIGFSGTQFNSGAFTNYTAIGIDNTTAGEYGGTAIYSGSASLGLPAPVTAGKVGLAEGYHYVTVLGYTNGGTASWTSTANGFQGCQLNAKVVR